ncbi:MAG: adenosylcobinamide-GDP ribazoletransferase [Gammaproteobacteria bacterium]|nr:adenosylcobinamide-GDP ribazoletransferase [Gammaproteobacteria bacterium]
MRLFHPFLIALQFLTRFPVHLPVIPDARLVGRSLLYYPLVGLVLGLVLAALNWTLGNAPGLLRAALLLAAWVLLTGALHLDGLADSADAWVGGLGDRERTLAIMKDPCCGPAAVVTLVVVLLVKFSALVQLASARNWAALVLAPVLGRIALQALFLTTPYVRPGGLGANLAQYFPRRNCAIVMLVSLIVIPLVAGSHGFWMILAVTGTMLLLRSMMIRRIGGMTGDTAGALVTLTEVTALMTAALLQP